MRLAYVDLCGFRGYRQAVRLDFAEAFTIIDGRNGVGKSTIFDAVSLPSPERSANTTEPKLRAKRLPTTCGGPVRVFSQRIATSRSALSTATAPLPSGDHSSRIQIPPSSHG